MTPVALSSSSETDHHRDWASARDDVIRVLVVDSEPVVQLGIRRLVHAEADFVLSAVSMTAEGAVAIAEREWIDVIVTDHELGSRNGLWLSRKLKRLADPPRVLVYCADADGLMAAACVVAQADALVSKRCAASELCDAIRALAHGARLLPRVPQPLATAICDGLGPVEQAIFAMLLGGFELAEISQTFDLPRFELESALSSMLHTIESLTAPLAGARPACRAPTRRTAPRPTRARGRSAHLQRGRIEQAVEEVHLRDHHGQSDLDQAGSVHPGVLERRAGDHRGGQAATLERADDEHQSERGQPIDDPTAVLP